jgi:serine/threonine protein kinase
MVRKLNFNPNMWRRSIGYEIQESLGEGSQGRVFKALRRDLSSNLSEVVAVKILHSETAVELWRNEFESLRRVHSKFCVQVFAFERIEGRPALVLEYVDGVSLGKLCQSGALREELVVEILAQLEAAIVDLHAEGLFHGDLSPHNILIDREGRLRLLDFGLANGPDRFTPEFAAPERHAGEGASLATDLFSIGRLEQFMRNESFHLNPCSPYLKLSALERKPRGLESSAQARSDLGAQVSLMMSRHRALRDIVTRALSGMERSKPRKWIMAVIAACMLSTASSAAITRPQIDGFLQIRTNQWHYFILDGNPIGYSPVSIPVRAGRTHRLEWISARGRGVKLLNAASQVSHVLQDRDF